MVRFKTVQITDLTDEDLQAMGAQDQLIDVREADEYEAGHIEDALNYPLSTLNTKFPLDQGKTYYIYCQKGGRSQQASQMSARTWSYTTQQSHQSLVFSCVLVKQTRDPPARLGARVLYSTVKHLHP